MNGLGFGAPADQAPLPHRKVGRYLKFLASEVDAWLLLAVVSEYEEAPLSNQKG